MMTPKKLKEIREKNNLTQEELALKMGVTNQYISCLERGVKPFSHKFETKLKQKGLIEEHALSDHEQLCKDVTEVIPSELVEKFEEYKKTKDEHVLDDIINIVKGIKLGKKL